ncbi:MAG: hypothetical protein ACXVP4_02800 [Bacteroidia bacterium]
MNLIMPLIIIVLLAAGFSSFAIARKIYRVFTTKNNKWATLISIFSFIVSFCIILWVIAYIILSNMEFGR